MRRRQAKKLWKRAQHGAASIPGHTQAAMLRARERLERSGSWPWLDPFDVARAESERIWTSPPPTLGQVCQARGRAVFHTVMQELRDLEALQWAEFLAWRDARG